MLHHDHHDIGHHDEGQDQDDEDDSLGCILKRAVFNPSDSFKFEFTGIEHPGKSISVQAIPFNYERLSAAFQPFLSLNPYPDLISYYSVFVSQGYGLRAPPVA